MLPTFSRDYAHWRSLRELTHIIIDAYEVASDEIVDTHFGGDPDAFQGVLQMAEIAPLPNEDNLRELIALIWNTSLKNFDLGYEDRDFLSRVRSHLIDALGACIEGDLERLAEATNDAYRALDFMTYKRKRTDKRDYHNPFANEKRKFESLTARTSRLARAFDKVAVSA